MRRLDKDKNEAYGWMTIFKADLIVGWNLSYLLHNIVEARPRSAQRRQKSWHGELFVGLKESTPLSLGRFLI